jgi:branched-chain amino acid transport system permease protein
MKNLQPASQTKFISWKMAYLSHNNMPYLFFQLLINSLIAGSIYALVSSGFSLIYHTNKFVHFAHGGVILLSAYNFLWLFSEMNYSLFSSSLITVALSAFMGFTIDRLFYKPLRQKRASSSIMLISSIAIFIILEATSLLIYGAGTKIINLGEINSSVHIFGAAETFLQMIILIVTVILFLLLYFFMKMTKDGQAMRAVADNKDLAEIVGISTEKVYLQSAIIGSSIAGIAAILISLEQGAHSNMGTNLMIKGFASSIIGGIGSVPGSILGSFLLGLFENFSAWAMPSGYKDALAFIFLFVFLIFKPSGILNNNK